MTRRRFLREAGIGLAAGLAAPGVVCRAAAGGGPSADRPNVILMMVDDMGFSDVGCYGGEIATPHLDALAQNGMRFVNMHNTARCWPSRACILSGQYPQAVGYDRLRDEAAAAEKRRHNVFIPEILGPAGYRTALSGKWHLDGLDPKDRGFERVAFKFAGQGGGSTGAGSYWHESFGPTRYITDHIADQVAACVEDFGGRREPFFIYWTPTAPHWPLHAFTADMRRYKGRYDAGPKALAEARYRRQVEMGIVDRRCPWTPPEYVDAQAVPKHGNQAPRDYRADVCTELDVGTEPPPDFKWCHWKSKSYGNKRKAASFEEMMEIYAAQVDRIDQSVGKVVAQLKKVGALENTLLVFCSDNGASREGMGNGPAWAGMSNTPMRLWKADAYEGGIATPFIVHWPARMASAQRGSINRTWGHLIDVMPTALAAAGAAYPAKDAHGRAAPPMEGRSLLEALEGKTVPLAGPIFQCHAGHRAAYTDKWKLVSQGGEPWALYDMEKDRYETANVAASRADLVADLSAQWEAWARRVGASV